MPLEASKARSRSWRGFQGGFFEFCGFDFFGARFGALGEDLGNLGKKPLVAAARTHTQRSGAPEESSTGKAHLWGTVRGSSTKASSKHNSQRCQNGSDRQNGGVQKSSSGVSEHARAADI